jgi:hypothetical protein
MSFTVLEHIIKDILKSAVFIIENWNCNNGGYEPLVQGTWKEDNYYDSIEAKQCLGEIKRPQRF